MKCVVNTTALNNSLLAWCSEKGIPIENNSIIRSNEEGLWLGEADPASVYFVSDGEFVKIGRTSGTREKVRQRIKQLATGNPRPMTALLVLETNYGAARWLENALHEMFKGQCVKNEWFDILSIVTDTDGEIPAISQYYVNPAGTYSAEECYAKEKKDGAA